LQIEGERGDFTLHCRPLGLQQPKISIVDRSVAPSIEAQIAELGAQLETVATHLPGSIEVVSIETGYFQLVEVMPVLLTRWRGSLLQLVMPACWQMMASGGRLVSMVVFSK
jgi:hypothetical protein